MRMKKILAVAVGISSLMFGGCSTNQKDVPFHLHAHTFDYGESIDSITFEIEEVDPFSITPSTFKVTASSSIPDGVEADENNYGVYTDVERVVDGVNVNGNTVELFLHCENGQSGEGTLSYGSPNINKNIDVELSYTISQEKDITVADQTISAGTITFKQEGTYDNPEIDAFQSAKQNDMTYYYYVPDNADDGQLHPLVLWLHGYGEGGYSGVDATNSTLRANRAAVCFTEQEAQEIFSGAFVVAPQAPTSWIEDLFNWGYGDLIHKDAFSMLIRGDRKRPERIILAGIIEKMKDQVPEGYTRKQKILLTVYNASPVLFDFICVAMGKRRNG